MPGRQDSAHRREYERRVNRVMDHVEAHLAEDLTLEKLAAVAAFSPFHFHRVFSAITGETLSDFIRRIRLERAASELASLPETSVLEIALRCGFSSAATFARAFKSCFGMSATEWRQGGAARWRAARIGGSKTGKAKSNPGKVQRNRRKALPASTRHGPAARDAGDAMPVRIETLPPYRVAYVRHVGPYGEGGRIGALWTGFERWIKAHGLRRPGSLTIGIGHDAPTISSPDKLRYDACVVVDAQFKADRRVNIADLPGGLYAVTPFEGRPFDLPEAWERLWRSWLPGSGYQPEARPCLELRRDFDRSAAVDFVRCELCLPIAPL